MPRSGLYITNFTGELAYRSFRPAPLPPTPGLELDAETVRLLVSANRHLAELDAVARYIPSVDLFISMYVRKEALVSSQIEGTQCTLDDVLDPEAESTVNADVADVINYVKAVRFALERLETLPLCSRLMREVHAVLLQGVRGRERVPGEFRSSQNWIGPAGCSLKDARYVPPNVEDMQAAMADLERYINGVPDEYDPLIRAALIHYQFETIHPFLDGNGRVGRMLVLLYLVQQELLAKPVIYVSYFLKKNQVEYYDRMGEVRRSGNYEQWVRFFLEAIDAAAVDSRATAEALAAIHERDSALLPISRRSRDTLREVFGYVEQHPIIDIGRTARDLSMSYNTAASCIRQLVGLDILVETTNARRNRVFAYEDYLSVLRKDT